MITRTYLAIDTKIDILLSILTAFLFIAYLCLLFLVPVFLKFYAGLLILILFNIYISWLQHKKNLQKIASNMEKINMKQQQWSEQKIENKLQMLKTIFYIFQNNDNTNIL